MKKYSIIIGVLIVGLWGGQPVGAETRKVSNDFDGDGKTDVAVYYPDLGLWRVYLIGSMTFTNVTTWRGPNYLPAPGDYNGDGKTDFVIFDSNTGYWYGKLSDGREGTVHFGNPGTWPVPADYDGDRCTDPAYYDPQTGFWSAFSLSQGWSGSVKWGHLGAVAPWDQTGTFTILPMPFDYDQDGKDDLGYYFRGTSMVDSAWSIFYLNKGEEFYTWGSGGSIPAPGKYESKTNNPTPYFAYGIGVYKLSTAEWSIPHRTALFYLGVHGQTLPVSAGDYDGNGFDDNAIYNYVTGEWVIIYNTGGLDVEGRAIARGFSGGPDAVPANIYSTIYALANYTPDAW